MTRVLGTFSPPPVDLLRTEILLVGAGVGVAFFVLGWLLALRIAGQHHRAERQRLERMRDHFIATVSHELRTPLTSINGSLGLLTAGLLERQPERAERMLRIAATNADRLARLVDDVLDVERLASGRATLDLRVCSPDELVSGAIESVHELATRKGIAVAVESTLEPGFQLRADPDRVQQVLCNLLDNALKFSDAGSSVSVSVEASAKDVRFSVRDQGQGIAPDMLAAIFERFQHADMSDARRTAGSGLGLAICKSIVEAHGGLIGAESDGEGAGSLFSFVIPR